MRKKSSRLSAQTWFRYSSLQSQYGKLHLLGSKNSKFRYFEPVIVGLDVGVVDGCHVVGLVVGPNVGWVVVGFRVGQVDGERVGIVVVGVSVGDVVGLMVGDVVV